MLIGVNLWLTYRSISLNFWIILWKVVLIGGISVFAVLAVVVSFFGFLDIKKLFKALDTEHEQEDQEAKNETNDATAC